MSETNAESESYPFASFSVLFSCTSWDEQNPGAHALCCVHESVKLLTTILRFHTIDEMLRQICFHLQISSRVARKI